MFTNAPIKDMNSQKLNILIAELQALLETQVEQKTALKVTEELIKPKKVVFLEILKTCVLKGVRTYNESKPTYIVLKDGLEIGVDMAQMTISAGVRLRCGKDEVFEEFDNDDVPRISKSLALFIDPILKDDGIPLTFDQITVPLYYYMK